MTDSPSLIDPQLLDAHEASDISAINGIVSSKSGNRQYYDLNGRRMPNDAMLPRGIYIVKEGDRTRKVVVK